MSAWRAGSVAPKNASHSLSMPLAAIADRDGRFVIGPDPDLGGLFWVAGLGGHGMTTSAGVGELAARGLVEGALPSPYREAFDPGRFTR